MSEPATCRCGHGLGQHPPDAARPFAWPCRACDCGEYAEESGKPFTLREGTGEVEVYGLTMREMYG